jgi:hypothetical protein
LFGRCLFDVCLVRVGILAPGKSAYPVPPKA